MRRMKFIAFLGLTFLCAAFSKVSAQQVFKTTPAKTAYYEYVPSDYNSNSNKYPIVIFLHGIGERGPNTTDMATLEANIYKVAKLGPPKYVKNGYKFPFILISPQLKSNYGTWPASYVMEIINHVKTYLRVDEKRIYLTGLSLGGGGVWMTIQDFAKVFAAAVPVCGGYNTLSKAPNIANEDLPVWASHGDKDSVVPVARTINMVNAINATMPAPNPMAKLTIYTGVAHNAWDYAYRTDHTLHTPNVYEWMLSKTNTINAGNKIPTAGAGTDQTKYLSSGSYIYLKGTGTDTDGGISTYTWTKVSGPTATLTNATTATLKVSSLKVGTYMFRLQVKDSKGNTDSDYVKLIVK
jgi:poly(3-hydroxybutyrate) depolymerase